MNTNRPDPLRCAALVLLSLACAALLIEIDSTTSWPATDPSTFLDWWDRLGTAGAAITLLRIVGIAVAGWGIFIGTAGLLASIRPSGLLHGVWRRITPGSFRRILAAGAITITLSAPAVAATSNQTVETQIVLEDLGSAPALSRRVEPARFTPVLADLGPATAEAPAEAPAESRPAETVTAISDKTASRLVEAANAEAPAESRPAETVTAVSDKTASRLPATSGCGHGQTPVTAISDKTASRLVEAANAEPEPHAGSDSRLWTVSEGDHLWKIAMRVLRDHGRPTEPAAVVGYWQQLIDVNSEVLNGNPDLIHPGTVLTLPAVPPQPA